MTVAVATVLSPSHQECSQVCDQVCSQLCGKVCSKQQAREMEGGQLPCKSFERTATHDCL